LLGLLVGMKRGGEVETLDGSSDGPSDGFKDGKTVVGLLDDMRDDVIDGSVLRLSDGLLVLSEVKLMVGFGDNNDGPLDGRKVKGTTGLLVGSYIEAIKGSKLGSGDGSTDTLSDRSRDGAKLGLLVGSPIRMTDAERIGASDGTRVDQLGDSKEGAMIGLLVGSSGGVNEGKLLLLVFVLAIKVPSRTRLGDPVTPMLRPVFGSCVGEGLCTLSGPVEPSDGVDDDISDGFELEGVLVTVSKAS